MSVVSSSQMTASPEITAVGSGFTTTLTAPLTVPEQLASVTAVSSYNPAVLTDKSKGPEGMISSGCGMLSRA